MRVKICGITNIEDALAAVKAGADALGFVFYKKSPRFIEPQKALEIVSMLPPFIERVGLFVNCDAVHIDTVCRYTKMSLAQIHFDASEDLYRSLETKYIRVIRAKAKEDLLRFSEEYRLVDAYCEQYGGSGKRLNLEWFENLDCSKIILAGGLTPENIEEVKKYGFYGVDVSSGVEMQKGKKDIKKVKEFIEKAKGLYRY
ncbi:phosphoribosylanthranilate isomerase [Nitrosophilus alvini]|uniref:phosphoribosylanthranilate isomerase n=1 Tax=Nitrosophilus alvini TaxID=2714855 RepID=UPI00190D9F7E|nr:phosphoribosylanthranilate isomerase [Nitrosophilus alvini]